MPLPRPRLHPLHRVCRRARPQRLLGARRLRRDLKSRFLRPAGLLLRSIAAAAIAGDSADRDGAGGHRAPARREDAQSVLDPKTALPHPLPEPQRPPLSHHRRPEQNNQLRRPAQKMHIPLRGRRYRRESANAETVERAGDSGGGY